LIDSIEENGFLHGIGKPERLKHFIEPVYSRRIDKKNGYSRSGRIYRDMKRGGEKYEKKIMGNVL